MRLSELNIICSALLMFCVGCKRNEVYPDVKVMGHAGNGLSNPATFYHDNSQEAISLALSKSGCDGVEVDAQLSVSGTLWLFHDERLSDNTGLEGCISTHSDNELSSVEYKTLHKEKLIRLMDVSSDELTGKAIYIDLRHWNACDNVSVDFSKVKSQLNAFQNSFQSTTIILFSQNSDWLQQLKAEGFQVMTEIQSIAEYHERVDQLPELDGVVARYKNISKEEVSLIQSEQREVVLFDMRSAGGSRKALQKMPNAVITDDLNATLIERNL